MKNLKIYLIISLFFIQIPQKTQGFDWRPFYNTVSRWAPSSAFIQNVTTTALSLMLTWWIFKPKKLDPTNSIHKTDLTFKNYAGPTRQSLRDLVRFFKDKEFRSKYEKNKLKPNLRFIFYGPPGTGKTHLAECLAGELDEISIFKLNVAELTSEYSGGTARNLNALFKKAHLKARSHKHKAAIIVIDEIDSLLPIRTPGEQPASRDAVLTTSTFLTCVDNAAPQDGSSKLIIIGTTNRKEAIDPAAVRPGRLEKSIYIGYPNAAQRENLLKHYIKAYQVEITDKDKDFLRAIAQKSLGSASSIKELVENALRSLIRNDISLSASEVLANINKQQLRRKSKKENVMTGEELNNILAEAAKEALNDEFPVEEDFYPPNNIASQANTGEGIGA